MEKTVLIETNECDYDEYYRIRCSPSDVYWNGYTKAPNYETFKTVFLNRTCFAEFSEPEDRRVYLVQNSDGVNVGFIQLIWREDGIEIGYSITEQYQRLGYATQALQQAIPLARKYSCNIMLRIRDDNIASQRVASKCGFSRTEKYIEKEYPVAGKVKLRVYKQF